MKFRVFFLISLGIAVAGWSLYLAELSTRRTSLHVLDVGQGDAILLRSGSADILVDGGPDATVLQRLGEVRPIWDRRLEVLILTHPQLDHLAGFLAVLDHENVGLVVLPQLETSSSVFRAFVESLIARRIPVHFAEPGQQLSAGQLTLTILAPGERARRLARSNLNNGGVVVRADFGRVAPSAKRGFSALLTGDIERVTEQELARRVPRLLDVDLLKVPHHGSKSSSSQAFLRAVSPAFSIISVGTKNRYGHPHAGVLARYGKEKLLRTDQSGTVSFRTDGGLLKLSCARFCQR